MEELLWVEEHFWLDDVFWLDERFYLEERFWFGERFWFEERFWLEECLGWRNVFDRGKSWWRLVVFCCYGDIFWLLFSCLFLFCV